MAAEKQRISAPDVITRETTIHLHKHVLSRAFKKRAPHAIKVIRAAAQKMMGTADVRVDPKLNKAIWEHGVHGVPFRIRVRFARKRNDEESAKHKLYTVATFVPVASFDGLLTEVIED